MKKFIRTFVSLILVLVLFVLAMPIYALEEVTVKEIEDLREENVKHFDMGDGTYKAVVYSEPVHRKDSEGKWTDIDNTLSEVKENGMTNYATADGRVKFSKNLNNGKIFELKENGYKISFSLLDKDIKEAKADIDNHKTKKSTSVLDSNEKRFEKLKSVDNLTKVRYNDIKKNIDIEYEIYSNNIKESIIVNGKQDAYEYTFELELNKLIAILNDDGSISLTDEETGEEKYVMPSPFMFDDKGELSTEVYYTLVATGRYKYQLKVIASNEWINAEGRAFPVTIDPTIEVTTSYGEAYVSSSNPTTNYKKPSNGKLYVSPTQRTFMKFQMPSLSDNAYIADAEIIVNCFFANGGSINIGAYLVPYTWDENTITWNNSVASHQSAESSATNFATEYLSGGTESYPIEMHFDMVNIVRNWYAGSPNNGIAIKSTSSSGSTITFWGYNSGSDTRPKLELTYIISDIGDDDYSIINGTFYLENAEAYKYAQNDITNVGLQIFDGEADQKWAFTYLNNGYHKIISSSSGKALTAPSAVNASVTLSDYNSSYNQMWRITQDSNGFYRLSPRSNLSYYLSGMNFTVNITNSQTNNRDEWEICTNLDYALAYVGDSDMDTRMGGLLEEVMGDLKTNAHTIGFGDFEVTEDKAKLLLSEARIFSFLGHGTISSISLSDGDLTISDINLLSNSAFSDLEFVYLAACDTGMGENDGNNLVNAIYDKGVDVVLGFIHKVDQEETNLWTVAFMKSLSNGSTIHDAMGYADHYIIYECNYLNPTTAADFRYLLGSEQIAPFAQNAQ